MALATDDEGVSRSDMSNEYLRAVTEQGLSYTQLRKITRDSLTYSFLEGDSLWDVSGARLKPVCPAITDHPAKACEAFLAANAKARAQWRLEVQLKAYEAGLPAMFAALQPERFPAAIRR